MADPLLERYGIDDPEERPRLLSPTGESVMRPAANAFDALPAPAPDTSGWMDARNAALAEPVADLGVQVSDYEAAMAAEEDAQIAASLGSGGFGTLDVAGAAGTAAGAARQRAADIDAALAATVTTPSRPNPVRPIREEHAQNAQAIMGAQQANRADIATGVVGEQLAMADAYAREAGSQQAMIDAQQAKLIRDQQRREQAIEAERHVFQQVEAAREKLASTPDDDHGRYWSNRKWWQKLAYVISAMADGWVGNQPNQALFAAIEGDIQDQRSAREARRGELAAATSKLTDARSLYADLRNTIGDEDTTMDAMRLARYEQAKSMLMAEQLRNGVPLQMAMQNQGILDLDAKINDTSAAIRERLALTPERIGGGTRLAITGPRRADLVQQRKESAAEARDFQGKAIDIGADATKQERAGQIDVEKERVKASAPSGEDKNLAFRQRETIAKETKNSANMKGIAKRLRKKYEGKDISGLTWGVGRHGAPGPEDETFQFEAGMLEYAATQAFTGASSPPEMQEALLNGIRNAGSEAEFWGAVDALEAWADADIERVNRAIDDAPRADYENVSPSALPQYDPSVPRTAEADPVAWDD